jgi:4-amino-4-deoxy-L-arabinose transferase-like glycosyltransferase
MSSDAQPAAASLPRRRRDVFDDLVARRNLLILLIFLFAISVQTLLFQFLPPARDRNHNDDYNVFYGPVADNLADGNGILNRHGTFAHQYPPGYPLLVAGTFKLADALGQDRMEGLAAFSVLISSLSCILVFQIAELIFARRVAALAALLWGTYPPNVWLSVQPNTEVPYIPLLLLSVFLTLLAMKEGKLGLLAAAGFSLGVGGLIRPIAVSAAAFLALGLFLFSPKGHRWKGLISGALLMTVFVLTILPWELYASHRTGGRIPLLTKSSSLVMQGLNSVVTDAPRNAKKNEQPPRSEVVKLFFEELRAEPLPVLKLLLMKLLSGWYATHNIRRGYWLLPLQLLYLFLAGFGLRLAFKENPLDHPLLLMLLLAVIGAWITSVLTVPLLRYMLPQLTFAIIFAALAVDHFVFRLGRHAASPAAAQV